MADVNVPQLPSGFKPVGTMIEPVRPSGLGAMSLGDIVNMAATTQAYQKQKATMPYEIEQKRAESESKQLYTALQKQEAIGASMISRINNPMIVAAEANPNSVNREELAASMQKWGAQQGKDLGLDPETTARLSQPYVDMAMNNPGQLRSYLKERHIAGLDQGARTTTAGILPQLTTAGGQPALFNPATGQITQPQVGGGQQEGAQYGGPASGAQGGKPSGIQLNYQPRPAGDVRPFSPGEAEEVATGQKYVQGLNDFGINSVKFKRNVDEVIAQADKLEKSMLPTSGILGAAHRKLATWSGDPTYVQLSKDLANVQIAALQASGGDLQTDAGKQLVAMANGDVTYPPEVLKNIANRTKADITNIDLQRKAGNAFFQKYGANNMGAFKRVWADNADSRVFQAMNIYQDENLDASQKKHEIDKLLGKDESQRKKFFEQYQNINKLVNTGSL